MDFIRTLYCVLIKMAQKYVTIKFVQKKQKNKKTVPFLTYILLNIFRNILDRLLKFGTWKILTGPKRFFIHLTFDPKVKVTMGQNILNFTPSFQNVPSGPSYPGPRARWN